MRKTYLLVIFILGISVSILGFFMLFNPSKSLTSVTLIIGLLFLLNGVNEVLGYISQAKIWNISRWHLFEGVFSLLFSMALFLYIIFAYLFFFLFNSSKSLTSVKLIIVLLFLLNGVNEVLGYISQAKIWNISRWHLIEGVFSVLIGMATFFYTNFAEQIFVFMFALWMLLSA